jgi:CBS domain containing-hemolysin-like protein
MDLLGLFSFRKDEEFLNTNTPNPKAYFPVYLGDLDHILGWISKEAVHNLATEGQAGTLKTEDIHVPAEFIPENMPLDQAFLKFVQESAPLFVVQNEAGVTTGILYLNDVLEEFFGLEIDPDENVGPTTHAAHG